MVVDAGDAPHAADVAVGVAAVELVLVVEVQRRRERLFRARAPLEDLLCPVHAHEAVHLAEVHHFALRRVPYVLVRLRRLKLRPAQRTLCLCFYVFIIFLTKRKPQGARDGGDEGDNGDKPEVNMGDSGEKCYKGSEGGEGNERVKGGEGDEGYEVVKGDEGSEGDKGHQGLRDDEAGKGNEWVNKAARTTRAMNGWRGQRRGGERRGQQKRQGQ